MKNYLFLFVFSLLLSCNKEISEPNFVKDFQSNIAKQYTGSVDHYEVKRNELEERACCFIVGRLENKYPGLSVVWAEEGEPDKKFFLMIYYNPTGPYFSSYNAWWLFSGPADYCGNSIGSTIGIGTAPSGYYRLYAWIGTNVDNFDICSSFIYNYHLVN